MFTTPRSSGFGSIQREHSQHRYWHLMMGSSKNPSVGSRHGQGGTRAAQSRCHMAANRLICGPT